MWKHRWAVQQWISLSKRTHKIYAIWKEQLQYIKRIKNVDDIFCDLKIIARKLEIWSLLKRTFRNVFKNWKKRKSLASYTVIYFSLPLKYFENNKLDNLNNSGASTRIFKPDFKNFEFFLGSGNAKSICFEENCEKLGKYNSSAPNIILNDLMMNTHT